MFTAFFVGNWCNEIFKWREIFRNSLIARVSKLKFYLDGIGFKMLLRDLRLMQLGGKDYMYKGIPCYFKGYRHKDFNQRGPTAEPEMTY